MNQHLDEKADLQLSVDGTKGCLDACLALRHRNPELKLLLSIGGGSGSATFPIVTASERTREAFARSARDFTDRFEFDGIDSQSKASAASTLLSVLTMCHSRLGAS